MDTAALNLTQAPQAYALLRDESQTPEARACARDYLVLLAIIDDLERQASENLVALAQAALHIKLNEQEHATNKNPK